ncbi:MAG: Transglycosylase domain protein, partial [Nocardioides sp.]|nr:Transglycosylase domain protein [Nocardioides sp.]
RSRTLMITLTTVVILAVAGTTFGYTTLSKSVTLSLDGKTEQVSVLGDTVGDALDAQGIKVGAHDVVAPGLDEKISDGSRITVHFGRPLELTVDGASKTYWVTSTQVAGALGEIGRTFDGAALSTSRGGTIDRGGLSLDVVTPKKLTIKVGAHKPVTREITALTVGDALHKLGVKVGKRDQVKPRVGHQLTDGDKVVFTNIRVVRKRVNGETLGFGTVRQDDSSMLQGQSTVARAGSPGRRNVTYRLTFRNGELAVRKVLHQRVVRAPVDEIVKVGTKQQPAPTTNFAGGSTVWDSLARCESGGNWAINTGNGYYGGLQFNLGTWQSYGGSGLPSNNSRDEQIRIATLVRNASGGYGAWPACAASLGLPR